MPAISKTTPASFAHHGGAYGLRPADRLRLVRGVERLMECGPRVVAELLIETAGNETERLLLRLDGYVRVAPLVEAFHAGDWTPPLRVIARKAGR